MSGVVGFIQIVPHKANTQNIKFSLSSHARFFKKLSESETENNTWRRGGIENNYDKLIKVRFKLGDGSSAYLMLEQEENAVHPFEEPMDC